MIGRKYSRLTVVGEGGSDKRKEKFWVCQCECGKETTVLGSNLRTGNTKSCGCWDLEVIKNRNLSHGMARKRIYKIWVGVRKRCLNPKTKSYSHYGGRGIKISENWSSFENFYTDMSPTYSDNLSLERIDPNGDYEKENCIWATWKQQARNKTNSVYIDLDGDKKTAAEWEEISGTGRCTIAYRIKHGWTIREAIFGKSKSIMDIQQYLIV